MEGIGMQDFSKKRGHSFPEGAPEQADQRAHEEQGRIAESRSHEDPFGPARP
jgi:hypothetical protein